jgi:hypothetical protein
MNRCSAGLVVGGCVLLALAGLVTVARGELADVYLKNGLRMRGDVTVTEEEVVLKNLAGEVRLPRSDIERIVAVPATQPASPTTAPSGATEAPAADEPPGEASGEEPGREKLVPAPLISKEDIQRLRMQELLLDGPAEPVNVRFRKIRGEPDLPELVLAELREREDFDPAWEPVLLQGKPHEQLQVILRTTGMKYADRIRFSDDPEVFEMYRRQVLPLIARSCARPSCHAGPAAQAYRFPMGPKTSETFAYSSFVILDGMRTADGPLINRDEPERSILLSFMLPLEEGDPPHPEVGRGRVFRAALSGREDPDYAKVLEWIRYLLVPRVDYGLAYENPYAGQVGKRPAASEESGE